MGLIQDIEALFDKVKSGIEARGVATDVSDLVNVAKAQGTQLLKEAGHDVAEDVATVAEDVREVTAPTVADPAVPEQPSTN